MIAIICLEPGMLNTGASSERPDYVPVICTHRPSLLPIGCTIEISGEAGPPAKTRAVAPSGVVVRGVRYRASNLIDILLLEEAKVVTRLL